MHTGGCENEKTEADTDDPFFGRMNDPTAAATITGPCGDTMPVASNENDTENRCRFHLTPVNWGGRG
jgi:hypothetical protein